MMEGMQFIFRWLHVFVGIIWIGHLYFFNFVNAPLAAKLDGPTKQKVVPELMPRALFWFRWGAAWTWITGVLLLLLVFYHGGLAIETDASWGAAAIAMIAVTFLAVFVYDALWSSGLKSNVRAANDRLFRAAGRRRLDVHGGRRIPAAIRPDSHRRHVRHDHGVQRVVPDLAGAAADHRRGEGRQGAGSRRPGAGRLRSKHNTYMSPPAAVGDGQPARDALLRRQLRDPERPVLAGLACGHRAGVAHHLPLLPHRRRVSGM